MALISSVTPVALVLRALALGDFLTGVPALRAIRKGLPQHRVVLATSDALSPLVTLASVADDVLATNGLEGSLGCAAPDVAVNLHGKGPESHQLLTQTSPARLVAFAHESGSVNGPRWRPDEHEVDRWCRLVAEGLGVAADPTDLLIDVPPAPVAHSGAVIVHAGAAFGSRRWPPERYADVARWARGAGFDVVVSGSPAEGDLTERICSLAELPAGANLAGRTSVAELAALTAHARLLVCGDTGMAHLATAFATPSVVLFGPVTPALWGPRTSGPHTVLWKGEGGGDPWGNHLDPALAAITVGEVLEAAADTLATSGRSSSPAITRGR